MELKNILDKRRSTRKFSDRKVEKQKLETIVNMTLQAPSSRNSRSTRLWVVEQPELLQHIADMRDYGSAFVKNAAAAILVMGDKTATDLWIDNCAISATILQLSIVDEGLASCWVHVNEFLREKLNIPENYGILCAIALGYSDFEPAALPAYEGEERVKWL